MKGECKPPHPKERVFTPTLTYKGNGQKLLALIFFNKNE
jgi:hypothetical protein